MDISSLRRWKILKHLTDEELCKIAYLQMYGGGRSSDEELSALFVTHDDEVYGTGRYSMVGSGELMTGEVERLWKVNALSGLGVTKLVVGWEVGAALTNNGAVYVWGSFNSERVDVKDEDILMFETYQPNKLCRFCSSSNYALKRIGKTSVNKCTEICSKYPTYTMDSPPPLGVAVIRLLKFSTPVGCFNCKTSTKSKKLMNFDFHFCGSCNMMLEVPKYIRILQKTDSIVNTPRQLEVSKCWKARICNIYSGSTFLVIETTFNQLILWGVVGDCKYQCYIPNPDNVHIKSVSCGGSHIGITSSKGELYTCGLGDQGQLGYQWAEDMGYMILRKVPLNGSVLKVCCGLTSTACLLSDGSIMCFGSNMETLSKSVFTLSSSKSYCITFPVKLMESLRSIDIVNAPLTNVFCGKTEHSTVFIWGKSPSPLPIALFEVSEMGEALVDLPFTYVDNSGSKDPVEQLSLSVISQENGKLFGNKAFSDLTLKLSDGDFPVHRLILHSNSTYFKEIFSSNEPTSDVLDMSPYNPTAYKCLLKHFYKLPLDDLNCEDLFDLYSIATSYKEKALVDSTFQKLKAMINQDTVLKLRTKAMSTNAEDLLFECDLFLSSPEFKNELISFLSQDKENAIAILRMKRGE